MLKNYQRITILFKTRPKTVENNRFSVDNRQNPHKQAISDYQQRVYNFLFLVKQSRGNNVSHRFPSN